MSCDELWRARHESEQIDNICIFMICKMGTISLRVGAWVNQMVVNNKCSARLAVRDSKLNAFSVGLNGERLNTQSCKQAQIAVCMSEH